MELKKFNDYTKDEQKKLLLHWWHYFGKVLYSLDELNQFNSMIDKNSNEVMMMAVLAYIYKQTSQPIIASMREGKIEEFRAILPILDEEPKEIKEYFEKQELNLLTQIVKTYNNPEPDVPFGNTPIVKSRRSPNKGKH
jgi:hypothetical protein